MSKTYLKNHRLFLLAAAIITVPLFLMPSIAHADRTLTWSSTIPQALYYYYDRFGSATTWPLDTGYIHEDGWAQILGPNTTIDRTYRVKVSNYLTGQELSTGSTISPGMQLLFQRELPQTSDVNFSTAGNTGGSANGYVNGAGTDGQDAATNAVFANSGVSCDPASYIGVRTSDNYVVEAPEDSTQSDVGSEDLPSYVSLVMQNSAAVLSNDSASTAQYPRAGDYYTVYRAWMLGQTDNSLNSPYFSCQNWCARTNSAGDCSTTGNLQGITQGGYFLPGSYSDSVLCKVILPQGLSTPAQGTVATASFDFSTTTASLYYRYYDSRSFSWTMANGRGGSGGNGVNPYTQASSGPGCYGNNIPLATLAENAPEGTLGFDNYYNNGYNSYYQFSRWFNPDGTQGDEFQAAYNAGDYEPTLTLTVPPQQIAYSFNVVAASDTPPTAPQVSGNTIQAGTQGMAVTYSASGTDPDAYLGDSPYIGNKVRYGFDWNNDGIVDEWVPSYNEYGNITDDYNNDYLPSGTPGSTSHTWTSGGVNSFQVLTQDNDGEVSPWTQYSTNITLPPPVIDLTYTGSNVTELPTTGSPFSDSPSENVAEAFDGTSDYDGEPPVNHGWLNTDGTTGIVGWQFDSGKVATSYIVYPYNGNGGGIAPKDWTFEGSNDGVHYTVLDTESDQTNWTYSVNWNASYPYVFDVGVTYPISNTASYTYYRLNISDNNGYLADYGSGNPETGVGELDIIGDGILNPLGTHSGHYSDAVGDTPALSFSTQYANSCQVSGAYASSNAGISNSFTLPTFNKSAQDTYNVTCEGVGGTTTQSVDVNVSDPAPEVALYVDDQDDTGTAWAQNTDDNYAYWFALNASSCTASATPENMDWSGTVGTSSDWNYQDLGVLPGGDYTYNISCENPDGVVATDSVPLSVSYGYPQASCLISGGVQTDSEGTDYIPIGSDVTYTANVVGGTPPLTYSWNGYGYDSNGNYSEDDFSQYMDSTLSTTYSQPGNRYTYVYVTDALGEQGFAYCYDQNGNFPIIDTPPNTPVVTGPTLGKPNTDYRFNAVSTDATPGSTLSYAFIPNDDQWPLYYFTDYDFPEPGANSYSWWSHLLPGPPGDLITDADWSTPGVYTVGAIATDYFGLHSPEGFAAPTTIQDNSIPPDSCSADANPAATGDTVTWSVSTSSSSPSFAWSGAGLDSALYQASTVYQTSGTKSASVTVTSNGVAHTVNCGSIAVNSGAPKIDLSGAVGSGTYTYGSIVVPRTDQIHVKLSVQNAKWCTATGDATWAPHIDGLTDDQITALSSTPDISGVTNPIPQSETLKVTCGNDNGQSAADLHVGLLSITEF